MEVTISMTHRLCRPPAPLSLLNGIGPCGNAIVSLEMWHNFSLPPTLIVHPQSTVPRSTDAQVVLRTLAHNGLVFHTHRQPAAPCFVTYKSESKPHVIHDFRAHNLLFSEPPRFHLPHFDSILSTRGESMLFCQYRRG